MAAGNLLRMRVNQGRSEDYLEADRAIDQDTGKRSVAIICTGEREFCLAGGRDDLGSRVAARPRMIEIQDFSRKAGGASAAISAPSIQSPGERCVAE